MTSAAATTASILSMSLSALVKNPPAEIDKTSSSLQKKRRGDRKSNQQSGVIS
jgi:hypothetical protein